MIFYQMVRPDAFLSRILHMASGAIVFVNGVAPWVFKDTPTLSHRLLIPILCGVSLLTGLYNAGLARPSQWNAGAGKYRAFVYAKIPLLFVFTPTFTLMAAENAPIAQGGVAALFLILGAAARFTREANTLIKPKAK